MIMARAIRAGPDKNAVRFFETQSNRLRYKTARCVSPMLILC